MLKEDVKVNKGIGSDPIIEQSVKQIFKVYPRHARSFTGELLEARGGSLLFEQRDGFRILIRRDEIAYAEEVVKRL